MTRVCAELRAHHCRKVQERFAWLDEKNARDTEGHLPQHPVSILQKWTTSSQDIVLQCELSLISASRLVSLHKQSYPCGGSQRDKTCKGVHLPHI